MESPKVTEEGAVSGRAEVSVGAWSLCLALCSFNYDSLAGIEFSPKTLRISVIN